MKNESIISDSPVSFIPKKFCIAAHTFKVQQYKELYDENGDSIYGQFDYDNLLIKIRVQHDNGMLLSASIIRNTYYHELMHSFNYLWNNECDESLACVFGLLMHEYIDSVEYGKKED